MAAAISTTAAAQGPSMFSIWGGVVGQWWWWMYVWGWEVRAGERGDGAIRVALSMPWLYHRSIALMRVALAITTLAVGVCVSSEVPVFSLSHTHRQTQKQFPLSSLPLAVGNIGGGETSQDSHATEPEHATDTGLVGPARLQAEDLPDRQAQHEGVDGGVGHGHGEVEEKHVDAASLPLLLLLIDATTIIIAAAIVVMMQPPPPEGRQRHALHRGDDDEGDAVQQREGAEGGAGAPHEGGREDAAVEGEHGELGQGGGGAVEEAEGEEALGSLGVRKPLRARTRVVSEVGPSYPLSSGCIEDGREIGDEDIWARESVHARMHVYTVRPCPSNSP